MIRKVSFRTIAIEERDEAQFRIQQRQVRINERLTGRVRGSANGNY